MDQTSTQKLINETLEEIKDINNLSDEDKAKIDAAYDNLINTSNISENDIETKKDTNEEVIVPEVVYDENNSLSSEKVLVEHNPITGDQTVIESGISIDDIINRQLDALEGFDDKDFNVFSKDELFKKLLNSLTIQSKSNDENEVLASIILRRINGENFDIYNALPDSMKREVDSITAKAASKASEVGANPKQLISRILIDDIIKQFKAEMTGGTFDIDTMLSGFDKNMEKIQDEMSTEVGKMMLSLDEERKLEIDEAIKRCEEQGKYEAKEKLLKMKNCIDDSFTLEKFSEACKNIKIKRGDLKKPDRVFNTFNFKYENHKNNINNIKDCIFFLSRHLPNYTNTHKLMLCLAFCKYCLNFSPDDIEEHTFMYYFIRNIIVLDRINPKGAIYETMDEGGKKFYDTFTKNLSICMDNLIKRNPEVANETY